MQSRKYKIEAFEWANIPTDLDRKHLFLVVAKTTKPTYHPEDTELPPIRKFAAKELHEAARSLARREVGLNHRMVIQGAFSVDANWNESNQAVEALLYIPSPYSEEIRAGRINQVSVEYNWRSESIAGPEIEFQGLVFYRVDILEGLNAGDDATWIKAVEGQRVGRIEGDIVMPCDKECPCAECNEHCKEKTGETDIKQSLIQDSVEDPSLSFFKECHECADKYLESLTSPPKDDEEKSLREAVEAIIKKERMKMYLDE